MIITDESLLNHKRCSRRAFLNVYGDKSQRSPEKDFVQKLKLEIENHCQKILKSDYPSYHQPQSFEDNWQELFQQTFTLMKQGVECIYKGKLYYTFQEENITYVSSPTLLIKQPIPSVFGDWSYSPVMIQFGSRPKPEYKIAATFNTIILSYLQRVIPPSTSLILRNDNTYNLNLKIWIPKTQEVIKDYLFNIINGNEPKVFISRQRCSLCRWYDSCYAIAKSQNHLSLVPGITPKRYEILKKKGISTLESLTLTSVEDMNMLMELRTFIKLKNQATSILENTPIFTSDLIPAFPNSPIELYFDIEAESEKNIDYLLGVLLIDKNKNEQKYYTFLAKDLSEEKKMWQDFLKFINTYVNAPIFHYSFYEVETMKRLAKLYTPEQEIDSLLTRFIDLHELVLNSVILPIENYSLKSIANWLNFYWRNPYTGNKLKNGEKISGDQCVVWYDQWLKTGDCSYLKYILDYNEDDCLATYHLKKWLENYFKNLILNRVNNC